jgi:hypothetical protein
MRSSSRHAAFRAIFPIMFAASLLMPAICSAASPKYDAPRRTEPGPGVNVRIIGPLQGPMAQAILKQVPIGPFTSRHDSSILLQGNTLDRLNAKQKQELKETYKAGYNVVLLDATMRHISALHAIIGEGMNYRSKDAGSVMAYALRRENHTPTAMLLTTLDTGPLKTPSGGPDPTGLADEDLALSRPWREP